MNTEGSSAGSGDGDTVNLALEGSGSLFLGAGDGGSNDDVTVIGSGSNAVEDGVNLVDWSDDVEIGGLDLAGDDFDEFLNSDYASYFSSGTATDSIAFSGGGEAWIAVTGEDETQLFYADWDSTDIPADDIELVGTLTDVNDTETLYTT